MVHPPRSRLIGARLRELRKKHGMTGIDLASRAGISQSKLSKIETGAIVAPDPTDIEAILNILKPGAAISQHILAALDAATSNTSPLQSYRPDYSRCNDDERKAAVIRIFAVNNVPSLLQTIEYRQALIKANQLTDYESNLHHLMVRQDRLWDTSKDIRIIMTQAALYTSIGTSRIHVTQLDRLERMLLAPSVTFGIIPTEAGLPSLDLGSFAVYDAMTAIAALQNRELRMTDEADIQAYLYTFEHLEHLAAYGEKARQLIRSAALYMQRDHGQRQYVSHISTFDCADKSTER